MFCGQTSLAQMYLGVSGACGLSRVGTRLPLPSHGEGSLGPSWISSVGQGLQKLTPSIGMHFPV